MIYYNHSDPETEINKILKQKNDKDFLYFSILWQCISEYLVPLEIIKIIFMLTHQYGKIKNCGNRNMIVNTDKTYLFTHLHGYNEIINNQKIFDIFKLGIRSARFCSEYAIILGTDHVLRYIHFVNNKIIIWDDDIKNIHYRMTYYDQKIRFDTFNIITHKNILHIATFSYNKRTKIYEYDRQISNILVPIRKIKQNFVITIDNVANYEFSGVQIKNVTDVCHIYESVSIQVLLMCDGTLQYKKNDNIPIIIPFDKEIVSIKGDLLFNTNLHIVTKNNQVYIWNPISKIINKLYDNVKSIHFNFKYVILLLKNNTVKFLKK